MLVRRLTPTDVDTLRTIRLEALRTDPDAFGSTLEREEGRSDDDWRAWLGRGATFVADVDGEPSGLVVALAQDDPSIVALLAMFVSSRARRSGVGQALVEAAVEWAANAGAERVVLMVIEGNTPAISALRVVRIRLHRRGVQSRDRDGATELEMARVIRTGR